MIRVFVSLFAIALAFPAGAQEAEGSETAQSAPDSPQDSGGLSLRGDDGDEVLIEIRETDEAAEPVDSAIVIPDTPPGAAATTPPATVADTADDTVDGAETLPVETPEPPAVIDTGEIDEAAEEDAPGPDLPDTPPDAVATTPPATGTDTADDTPDSAETLPLETPELPVLIDTGETDENAEQDAPGNDFPDTPPDADEATPPVTGEDVSDAAADGAEVSPVEIPEVPALIEPGETVESAEQDAPGIDVSDTMPEADEATPPVTGAETADDAADNAETLPVQTPDVPVPDENDLSETDNLTDLPEAATDTDDDPDTTGAPLETEPASRAGGDESGENGAATLTLSAPFLSSTEYAAIRPDSIGEAVRLIWRVETFNPAGERIGAADTRTLILAPDHVRYERGGEIEIYDFAANRHLELDLANATMTNTAFEAEVRRRLDTYLGLSQAGRLEQIPLGPDRSFERFWLEAAMGIRREPAELEVSLSNGELVVDRVDGTPLLTAQFDISGDAAGMDDAAEAEAADEAENVATETSAADAIAAMATPIDLSSGESVVFDPSQAAAPITPAENTATFAWPAGAPEQQAQAELFRRWMRHALPLHPDVLAVLRGAPDIPSGFAYFIVSPDSPEGRREVWTLQQSDIRAPGFRLEPDLAARAASPDWLGTEILPVTANASAVEHAPDDTALLEAIADYREAGDLARAFLVTFHETSRNGPCPPPGQTDRREVCAAANSVVAGGLGNPSFETVFAAINEIGSEQEASILEALAPYLEDTGYVGAAARTIVANELIAWASRDPEAPPADLDPFNLLTESIAIDPHAGANYRYLGNALMSLRNPIGAWTVYDAGRSVPAAASHVTLVQVSVLEERLRALAPDFFLPR